MNNIFSILAVCNAEHPSPEVLQPRFPSLFEPFGTLEGQSESFLDQTTSLSPQAAGWMETGQPSSSPTDRESHSSNNASIREGANTKKTMDQSFVGGSVQPNDVKSGSEITIPQSAHLPISEISFESVLPSVTSSPHEEMYDDFRRSATIMNTAERIQARTSANDPHREKIIDQERKIHPRIESVTAHKVDRLVEPTRNVPGRTDKKMDVLQPREESFHTVSPVVRIHIGRIDVRAVTPPPSQPASKPAPAQPRLTLDDYLRQREGRR